MLQETNYVPITRGNRVVLMVNGYVQVFYFCASYWNLPCLVMGTEILYGINHPNFGLVFSFEDVLSIRNS